jgi:hypothetical protein
MKSLGHQPQRRRPYAVRLLAVVAVATSTGVGIGLTNGWLEGLNVGLAAVIAADCLMRQAAQPDQHT